MKEGYQIKLSLTPYVKPNAFSFKAKLTKFYLEEEVVTRPSRNGISIGSNGNMRFYHMIASSTTKIHQRHEIMFDEGKIRCDTNNAVNKLFNLLKVRGFIDLFFEFFDELNNETIIHGLNLITPDWLKLINEFQGEYLQTKFLKNKIMKIQKKISEEHELIEDLTSDSENSEMKILELHQHHSSWSKHRLLKLQTNQQNNQLELDNNKSQYEANKKEYVNLKSEIEELANNILKLKTKIEQDEYANLLLSSADQKRG